MSVVETCPWPSAEVTQCPFPLYEALRSEQPVRQLPGTTDFLVSRWEDIVHVTQHPEIFSNLLLESGDERVASAGWMTSTEGVRRRRSPYSMSSTDPPDHKPKRTLGLQLVTHAKMREYEPMVRRLTNELIDRWIDDGHCDFTAELANKLPIEVICEILGLPRSDVDRLQWLGDVEAGGAARYTTQERADADREKLLEMTAYVRAAIESRIDTPTDDFLTELIEGQRSLDGELDLDYLVNEATLILFAGNVTTAHLLSSQMVYLCRQPGLIDALRGNVPALKQFAEEVLRLEAPVQWVQRIAARDTEIDGVPIPRGAWVIILLGSGNRDEARYSDPDVLDLARRQVAKHNLVFGRGIHLCLGAPLARLEGWLAYQVLLERLASIEIDEDRSDLRNLDSVRFRAPRSVCIRFEPAVS